MKELMLNLLHENPPLRHSYYDLSGKQSQTGRAYQPLLVIIVVDMICAVFYWCVGDGIDNYSASDGISTTTGRISKVDC